MFFVSQKLKDMEMDSIKNVSLFNEFLYDFSDSPYHVYMKVYEKNIWVCVHSELGKDEHLFVFNEQGKLIQGYSVPDSELKI